MKSEKHWLALAVLGFLMMIAGCENSKSRRAAVTPPAAANAPTLNEAVRQPEPPRIEAKPLPQADPVEGMVARAERAFETGKTEYAAGHLEAAKRYFDQAVNLLMEGPVDVQSDDRLQREFDRVVDEVNRLEMAALKEGDGFVEQQPEPAPIDEANAATFPVDLTLKAQAEEELRNTQSDLPLVINDYVAGYISFFTTRGRGQLERAWRRRGRYEQMIRRTLREEGVPQDLIYLAQAESGFHPLALSRVGARGMWQFMHYTAPGFGLKRNWWVDDRQDPEKSTRAAARYLKDLYNQFGDWYLAMAAYNSGAGNVQRAVQRTGYVDFWELYRRNVLPEETKNYVPIIVAMTIIGKNPAQYGLNDAPDNTFPEADRVMVDYAVDLRLVAEAIDVPVSELADLNPSLLRRVTPKDGGFELKLPPGASEKFLAAIAAVPKDKRVAWRYHKVLSGETLSGIAKKYETTTQAIAAANTLDSGELAAETKLVIPSGGETRAATGKFSRHPTRYRVRKGDTVLSVADDFGVPPEKVRGWNRLKGNGLRQGRVIVIYKPVADDGQMDSRAVARRKKSTTRKQRPAQTAAHKGVTHRVKKGETLTSIASHYKTTVAELQRYNGPASEDLRPGDVLIIRR